MEIELGVDPLRKKGLNSFSKDFFSHSLENVSSILQNSKSMPKIQKSNSVTALSEKRIGPFIVGESIGVGAYSHTYVGVHISSKEEVYLKTIDKKMMSNKETDLILEEIKILKTIQHPNVVKLLEVMELPSEVVCLVLEYAGGGSLFDYIRISGKLPEAEACKLFIQIVDSIECFHKFNIVHRDLKPESILLDFDKSIKLYDFSIATFIKDGKLNHPSKSGSQMYMAPEVINSSSEEYDFSADIWSLGVIVYQMVTGMLPWAGANSKARLERALKGQYEQPTGTSPEFIHLLSRMLEINPKKRASIWEIKMHAWMKQTPQKKGSFLSRLLTKRTRSSDAIVRRASIEEQPNAKKSKSFQELRISKSTFKAETSSLKSVEEIVSELERVFSLLSIEHQPSQDKGLKYICRDVIRNVKFEVEVCKIDKLEGFKGIKIKKKSGSNYDFSALQENLRSLLKL